MHSFEIGTNRQRPIFEMMMHSIHTKLAVNSLNARAFFHFSFSHFNKFRKISIAQLINLMTLKCDSDDDDVAAVAAAVAIESILFEF